MSLPTLLFVWLASLTGLLSAYDATVCGTNGYSSPLGNYTYSANAWNAASDGFQCLSITNSPASFDATWSWPTSAGSSVLSYPHVTFIGSTLPAVLSDISVLQLAVKWGMAPEPASTSSTGSVLSSLLDSSALEKQDTKANVAFDMFLDLNASSATSATTASTEVMIWLATVGNPKALGYAKNRTCFSQKLGSVKYILYTGTNQRGLDVFSWVAEKNITSFDEDISPLIQYLWRNELISSNLSVGLLQFGSETYTSLENVTFSAANFTMDLEHGAAPTLKISSLPTACSGMSKNVARQLLALIVAVFSAAVVHLLT